MRSDQNESMRYADASELTRKLRMALDTKFSNSEFPFVISNIPVVRKSRSIEHFSSSSTFYIEVFTEKLLFDVLGDAMIWCKSETTEAFDYLFKHIDNSDHSNKSSRNAIYASLSGRLVRQSIRDIAKEHITKIYGSEFFLNKTWDILSLCYFGSYYTISSLGDWRIEEYNRLCKSGVLDSYYSLSKDESPFAQNHSPEPKIPDAIINTRLNDLRDIVIAMIEDKNTEYLLVNNIVNKGKSLKFDLPLETKAGLWYADSDLLLSMVKKENIDYSFKTNIVET